jgi:hypothetical protein
LASLQGGAGSITMQVRQPFLMFNTSVFIEKVLDSGENVDCFLLTRKVELNVGENVELEKVLKVTKKKSAGRQITSLQVSCSGSVSVFFFLLIRNIFAQPVSRRSFRAAILLGS